MSVATIAQKATDAKRTPSTPKLSATLRPSENSLILAPAIPCTLLHATKRAWFDDAKPCRSFAGLSSGALIVNRLLLSLIRSSEHFVRGVAIEGQINRAWFSPKHKADPSPPAFDDSGPDVSKTPGPFALMGCRHDPHDNGSDDGPRDQAAYENAQHAPVKRSASLDRLLGHIVPQVRNRTILSGKC